MNMKRLAVLNVIIILVLIGGGIAGYYYYDQSVNYIKTDNAIVAGEQVTIAAPANGKLTKWKGDFGKKFDKDDEIGTIAAAPAPGGPAGGSKIKITVPKDGTIVQQSAVENSFVAAGTPLARVYDLKKLWVTANVKETDINDVKVDQKVDIYIDAYPDQTFKGVVKEIGLATGNTFSLLPSSNNTGNYTKVTQVIPVKISIDSSRGQDIVPGMNVNVRIHK
ncbi:secretion protein HlyD family protein [Fictibacillus macauensis ZFHKF-1]|uniref:Secretion protein HlyD family protein n=1 Tax=Fictibacillus macauensis ZFHKF-1 TaxID=1196324 RepID=I8U9M2_9BACL|nr:efflux RND transporter periplasmic adaptor subunit [Fictibacillus macauensis]EIT83650.1 secretion protein HlyD family protein [Fictibacillus macauensis ZFHKF-1]